MIKRAARALLAPVDRWMNRLYGWRYNPLYASGAITVGLLVVLLVTGVYLLLFYRIGAPYESVERITGQVWLGRWIRSLHRYASDLAVVAAVVHGFRMFAQGRSWGPRALGWVSGLVLLGVLFVSGWTGYVMVWDVQAQLLAVEGARLLDLLPLFSEPIGRTFVGDRPLPAAFFFLNLFLHIALPIGMGLVLWLHVSRVARPVLVPAGVVSGAVLLGLLVLSVVWPVGMDREAELLRLPGDAQLDLFYGFWLPVTRALPAVVVWAGGGLLVGLVVAVPWLVRPGGRGRPAPSVVEERLCTGCEQCYEDCPYDAISMVPRRDGRSGQVAVVNGAQCVSCGICAGSCAPMGVGPPGRTGRDQLAAARAFAAAADLDTGDVVVIGCDRGPLAGRPSLDARIYPVGCAGSLHTSVVEYLLKAGAGGVLVAACPETDCWNREGGRWARERLYHDREAELQARVDRTRVRLVNVAAGEIGELAAAVASFRRDLRSRGVAPLDEDFDLVAECLRGGPVTGAAEIEARREAS